MPVDPDYVTRALSDLVAIPSVNPAFSRPGDAAAPGEAAIADDVARKMRAIGLDVELVLAAPGRPSVVGILEGKSKGRPGRSLVLNGHIDTVGPGDAMERPFAPEIRGGRLFGRGAYDMKGSVAAMLGAAKALADEGAPFRGRVIVEAVADEEDASLGTLSLVKRFPADGAIVTEPTANALALAHRGFSWIRVTTKGFACHGSRYDLGVDANLRMGRVLARLEALERDLAARRPHPLAGRPSLHAALIRGGVGPSIYAPSCTLDVERRTAPGETREGVLAEVRAIVEELAREDPGFEAAVEETLAREPFESREGGGVARAVRAAARREGAEPKTVGVPFWTDAAILAAAGVDTVVFGNDGAGAHEDVEWVDLASTHALARTLAAAVAEYCS